MRYTLPPLKNRHKEHLREQIGRLIQGALWAAEHASSPAFKESFIQRGKELVALYEKLERRGWSGKVFNVYYQKGFRKS